MNRDLGLETVSRPSKFKAGLCIGLETRALSLVWTMQCWSCHISSGSLVLGLIQSAVCWPGPGRGKRVRLILYVKMQLFPRYFTNASVYLKIFRIFKVSVAIEPAVPMFAFKSSKIVNNLFTTPRAQSKTLNRDLV